jgi:hypothetical protein
MLNLTPPRHTPTLPIRDIVFGHWTPPLHLLRDGEAVGRWTSPASDPLTPIFAGKGSGGPAGTVAFAGGWWPEQVIEDSPSI